MAQSEDRQKMFEPIIQSNIQAAKEIGTDLVPIRKELEQLNQEIAIANIAPQQTILPPETPQRRRSLPSIPTPQQIGNLPVDHLRQAVTNKSQNDSIFGIYNKGSNFMIGSEQVEIKGNDIEVNGKHYQGSPGPWQLLTKKEPKEYTENDLQNYKRILINTNALYQNYDPTSNKPRSSRSSKWALVKPFWSELTGKKPILQPSKLADAFENLKPYAGMGVVYLSQDPVELTNRLQLLVSEFKAGNTTTSNEIVAIMDELARKRIIDSNQYSHLHKCLF